jgi:hypothetical protein
MPNQVNAGEWHGLSGWQMQNTDIGSHVANTHIFKPLRSHGALGCKYKGVFHSGMLQEQTCHTRT